MDIDLVHADSIGHLSVIREVGLFVFRGVDGYHEVVVVDLSRRAPHGRAQAGVVGT